MAIPDPRTHPTVTVEVAGEILGTGSRATYRAVRTGQIPSIRVGRLIRIPTASLLALLGQDVADASPTATTHDAIHSDALSAGLILILQKAEDVGQAVAQSNHMVGQDVADASLMLMLEEAAYSELVAVVYRFCAIAGIDADEVIRISEELRHETAENG